jgi:hypothetical protein
MTFVLLFMSFNNLNVMKYFFFFLSSGINPPFSVSWSYAFIAFVFLCIYCIFNFVCVCVYVSPVKPLHFFKFL